MSIADLTYVGPMVSLPEIALLPIMALLTWLGGGSRIRHAAGRRRRGFLIGAIAMILFSGMHEGFGWIVAMLFGESRFCGPCG